MSSTSSSTSMEDDHLRQMDIRVIGRSSYPVHYKTISASDPSNTMRIDPAKNNDCESNLGTDEGCNTHLDRSNIHKSIIYSSQGLKRRKINSGFKGTQQMYKPLTSRIASRTGQNTIRFLESLGFRINLVK